MHKNKNAPAPSQEPGHFSYLVQASLASRRMLVPPLDAERADLEGALAMRSALIPVEMGIPVVGPCQLADS